MRMHADQFDVTADAVARLVGQQFPRWRGRRDATSPPPRSCPNDMRPLTDEPDDVR